MHKIYTCKYFAIWSKYTHISKSIFNLRSHAKSVHISILNVNLDQLFFDRPCTFVTYTEGHPCICMVL